MEAAAVGADLAIAMFALLDARSHAALTINQCRTFRTDVDPEHQDNLRAGALNGAYGWPCYRHSRNRRRCVRPSADADRLRPRV